MNRQDKNVIDINNPSTYPQELKNLFRSISIEQLSQFDDSIILILKKYYFKCIHVSRIFDIENIKKYGLLRPMYYDNDKKTYVISQICKDIILHPLKNVVDKNTFENIFNKYDELLIKEFEESLTKKCTKEYYGKYSVVCCTMDCDADIQNESKYNIFGKNYGGEILCVIIEQCEISNPYILKLGKPYAIFYKIKCDIADNLNGIIKYMYNLNNGQKFQVYNQQELYIDIPPKDILEIRELNINE